MERNSNGYTYVSEVHLVNMKIVNNNNNNNNNNNTRIKYVDIYYLGSALLQILYQPTGCEKSKMAVCKPGI